MVRIKRSYRIQVCGTKMRPMASSPRIINRGTVQTPKLCKKPRRSPSSLRVLRPQALRNTSAARPASCQALLPFRSLDPFRALREPDRRRRDEERLFRSEQGTDTNQKRLLDRKSPIQVRILLPPGESQLRT